MAGVKTKAIDTSSTTPGEFLASGAGKPVDIPPPSPETPTTPAKVPLNDPNLPTETVPPVNPPAEPAAPVVDADPFVLLHSWEGPHTKRTLRGMNVNGGVVLRLASATGGFLTETMCFVPKCEVKDGKLTP